MNHMKKNNFTLKDMPFGFCHEEQRYPCTIALMV